jgi:hypothetical protein
VVAERNRSRGDAGELHALGGGTPFRKTPYRYQEIKNRGEASVHCGLLDAIDYYHLHRSPLASVNPINRVLSAGRETILST